ncbi:hypothetical protein ANO11243_043160 [Dothideomycetidae sp. 11243]|nr:hypothetical protein ANO11243_043160 [fungal sp. No.11243]
MASFIDDKSEHCIPFILERIKSHREAYTSSNTRPPPFFVGINGVQGAGKTTLVSTLKSTLSSPPHSLPTAVLSIDDLYLPHEEQVALAARHRDNPLVQHRGQPSTHDIGLGTDVFAALSARKESVALPSYDKSRFDGSGDRRPRSKWQSVGQVDVVIFEGWCVGFRARGEVAIEKAWREAREELGARGGEYQGRLAHLKVRDVLFVDRALKEYDVLTE